MKRFVLILLAMALCASCAAAQETAVTKVRAPLYAGPRAQGTPQMTYVVGVKVELTGEAENGYVQVTVGREGGSLMGWMEERDLAKGEKAARFVQAEQMHFRGTEMQTSSLYSKPDRSAAVLNDSFCLTLRDVIGYSDNGVFMHVRERDGSTGFVCMNDLEGYQVEYSFEPYIRVTPVDDELTVEEAVAYAKEVILTAEDSRMYTGMPDEYADAEKLAACMPEVEVLYYFDEPDRLTYIVGFCNTERDVLYAGLSFQWVNGQIVNVSGGNG